MAVITSNGTGGGGWSSGSSWIGGIAPGAGDRAIISSGDTIYIDGDTSVGDGTDSTSTYAVDCAGTIVWRNRSTDSAASWTFTVDGHMQFTDGGRWFIGTEDNSLFGAESVGPIPATRTANVYFANDYYHRIYFNTVDNPDRCFELWGVADFHRDTAPSETGQTVDSAADRFSFVDSARTSDAADVWVGAWLEVTAGTNVGQCREVTAFDNSTGTITWSSNQPMPKVCDSTTEYTITHNYQRAMLTASAAAGVGTTITLDRPVNYEVGDTLGIGSSADYENVTERPDYTTIVSKISSTQYTCDLTYDHTAGDFVIHMDRNIKFDCNLGGASTRGYYFYFYNGNPEVRVNDAWFENCGYSSSYGVFHMPNDGDYPIIKNVSCKGWIIGSTVCVSPFLDTGAYTYNVSEDYMVENVHGFNLGGLIYMDSYPLPGVTLADQENLNFRELTLIGCNYSSGAGIRFDNRNIVPHKIKNFWMDGRPINHDSNRVGRGITSGMCELDGFKFRQCAYGIYANNSVDGYSLFTSKMSIKNGSIQSTATRGIYFTDTAVAQAHVENVNIIYTNDACLLIDECGPTTFILINNTYDGVQSSGGGGLYIWGSHRAARIEEMGGKYGTISANEYNNILLHNTANYRDNYRYIGHNVEFVEPTNATPSWSSQPEDAHKIFTIGTGDGWSNRIRCLSGMSSVELYKPVVDSVAVDSIGLINGGGFVMVSEHPTTPRTDSNISLRALPFSAMGETQVNRSFPITAYAESGQTVELSVYAIKNVTQLAGSRPKMHVLGNGVFETVEMSDAIDTWEELTISYTAQFDGTFDVWFTCCNNLKYAKTATTDDAESGEPDDIGTVDVYFDEYSATVS